MSDFIPRIHTLPQTNKIKFLKVKDSIFNLDKINLVVKEPDKGEVWVYTENCNHCFCGEIGEMIFEHFSKVSFEFLMLNNEENE